MFGTGTAGLLPDKKDRNTSVLLICRQLTENRFTSSDSPPELPEKFQAVQSFFRGTGARFTEDIMWGDADLAICGDSSSKLHRKNCPHK